MGWTGVAVCPMALGTMQFGWTASHVTAFEILDAYRAAGGNLIDTADMYGGNQSVESYEHNRAFVGLSEEIVGRWLASRHSRDDVLLVSKVRARVWDGPDGEGLHKRHILRAIDETLRRLRTDHIDVYLAHWPDPDAPIEEMMEAFGEVIAAGKARFMGTSNFCNWEGFGNLLKQAIDLGRMDAHFPRVAVEEPRFNLMNRGEYEGALQALTLREELGIICWSPLAGGFLSGKFRRDVAVPENDRNSYILRTYANERGWAVVEALAGIAHRRKVPIASVALAWLLSQAGVTAVIVGADCVQQVADAAPAATLDLGTNDLRLLTGVGWPSSECEFVGW